MFCSVYCEMSSSKCDLSSLQEFCLNTNRKFSRNLPVGRSYIILSKRVCCFSSRMQSKRMCGHLLFCDSDKRQDRLHTKTSKLIIFFFTLYTSKQIETSAKSYKKTIGYFDEATGLEIEVRRCQ